jgi:hypothetical protein
VTIPHIVKGAPGAFVPSRYTPFRGPYMWWDTKDWEGGASYPYAGTGTSNDGTLINRGVAGATYDLGIEAEWGGGFYELDIWCDMFNFASDNVPGLLLPTATPARFPEIYRWMPETFFTDIGGQLGVGGPLCWCALLSEPGPGVHTAGTLSFQDGEVHFWGFDYTNGVTLFMGDYDQDQFGNFDIEVFIEWFDYTVPSNFSEIRGPNFGKAQMNGTLLTGWQDSLNGAGDILVDTQSLREDPTLQGVFPTNTRNDMFWKYLDNTDLNPANDPDSVYTDFVNDTSLPHELYIQHWRGTFTNVPAEHTKLPGIECVALFRGVPSLADLVQIKADMIAGGVPTTYGGV